MVPWPRRRMRRRSHHFYRIRWLRRPLRPPLSCKAIAQRHRHVNTSLACRFIGPTKVPRSQLWVVHIRVSVAVIRMLGRIAWTAISASNVASSRSSSVRYAVKSRSINIIWCCICERTSHDNSRLDVIRWSRWYFPFSLGFRFVLFGNFDGFFFGVGGSTKCDGKFPSSPFQTLNTTTHIDCLVKWDEEWESFVSLPLHIHKRIYG